MTDTVTLHHLDAYHSAIVRISTVRDRIKPAPSHLLFASVELITSSRPIPDTMAVNDKGVPQVHQANDAKLDLAFRKVAMDASDAVTWYRSLRSEPTLPIPRCGADRGQYDGTPIQTSTLTDEPVWPSSSMPLADPSLFGSSAEFYPTPFIGSGAYPAKVHRQLGSLSPVLERVACNTECRSWLQHRIHFDISRYDELLGGAVLVIPDPDVRKVSTFMARAEDGREHLIGCVHPRRDRSLDGFTLTLFEERFGAMNLFKNQEVGNELMIVPAADQLEHTGYALSHVERGLVDQQKATPYLRSISLNMNPVSRRIRFETRDNRRKGAEKTVHSVNEVGATIGSLIELEKDSSHSQDTASRFYSSAARRKAQRIARPQELQWFDQREIAVEFIRQQIGTVRETIMIVDPYADGEDLFNFGHFVTRVDIKLRVLTSRLAFEGVEQMNTSFVGVSKSFEERGLIVPEVKILRGRDNPPIHDRFLVTDNDVWLSGNSLNTIGQRASVMLKLPDPAKILERLERFFDEARPLQLRESD